MNTRNQIQAGIDARTDQPILNAAAALSLGYRTLYGYDGTSVDDAARQAWTPTGPSLEILRARIAHRRGLPTSEHRAEAA